MTTPSLSQELDTLFAELQHHRHTMVGYPCNQNFDYSPLYRFLQFSINNIGDPFATSNLRINSHALEREVLSEAAKLWHAPEGQWWGYITNGGTEGNLYGLYLAREMMPGGIVYFSEDTHYSVAKIVHVIDARSIMIRSQKNGEIDYDDLRETLRIHRDAPPIIFANIGTTMTGAIDDLNKIKAMMKELAITRYYIHADAALSGMILPFVENPPPFDFAAGIDSMSVSGHKFIGSPIPCGFAMAKKSHVDRIARSVEYVGAVDTTITGSRNAISPLMLWYAWRQAGVEGFRKQVGDCLTMTDYAVERFRSIGVAAWTNPHANTVVFPRPSQAVMDKWQIAPYKEIAHVICMPHITKAVIDELTEDMRNNPPETGR
jgi:histidine decarboxylase